MHGHCSGVASPDSYDVNASLPVLLDDGSRKYVWGLGLAYAVDSSGVLVYHSDGLGSVRAITEGAGVVVQTYRYDEYGVSTESQGSVVQPFQYTGEQWDSETGLLYLRARMYDGGTGRFISRDPWPGTVYSPSSMNRFIYVGGNPVGRIDPSGLFCVSVAAGGNVEVGAGFVGEAGTVSSGIGVCVDLERGFDIGSFQTYGGYMGTPWSPDWQSIPPARGNTTVGAFGGVGLGLSVSNAKSIRDLAGPSQMASVDASIPQIPLLSGSAGVSWNDQGTWSFDVSGGPGFGLAVNKTWTNTRLAWSLEADQYNQTQQPKPKK